MKKILFIIILLISFVLGNTYSQAETASAPSGTNLLDYANYKKITPDNIKSLKIIRYTEAGIAEKSVEDKAQINTIYNFLKQIKVLSECKMGCTDNTTIYSFTLNDDSKASVEFECDWIVLKGKNYNFYLPSAKKVNNYTPLF